MTTPRIKEMVENIEKSLEAKFNLVVRALIQNINGTITEGERMDICNKLNQDGINEIRQALAEAHQAGIDEAVENILEITTWYQRNAAVDEIEDGVSYIKVSDIEALQDNK